MNAKQRTSALSSFDTHDPIEEHAKDIYRIFIGQLGFVRRSLRSLRKYEETSDLKENEDKSQMCIFIVECSEKMKGGE
jgi:hypothetical protein